MAESSVPTWHFVFSNNSPQQLDHVSTALQRACACLVHPQHQALDHAHHPWVLQANLQDGVTVLGVIGYHADELVRLRIEGSLASGADLLASFCPSITALGLHLVQDEASFLDASLLIDGPVAAYVLVACSFEPMTRRALFS